ncbi:ankyrin [Melanomma pulvis-pyrius CBS 109.77]|uniref:Ankyrin n=1 Tax=Melanomma pulvis-pyrius CBS 109.77 TaxID=1314802 RepID=A0A6A6XRY0_9PLEO|nr:ankyrin [Melanomma pulvis-pyrius CBS 109.77]
MLDLGIEPTPDALYLAASQSHSDVVEVLTGVMDDIDTDVGWAGNALCAAACNSSGYNTIKVLLERGANVNWQGGKYGCPLQSATACYRLENVKLLLKYGADVDAQCGHYGNALTAAARHRTHFEEMTTLFLEHGADINAEGPGAYGNPLQTAVYLEHVESVKFLLEHGASKTVQGQFGSALDIAQRYMPHSNSDKDVQRDILKLLDLLEKDQFGIFITED